MAPNCPHRFQGLPQARFIRPALKDIENITTTLLDGFCYLNFVGFIFPFSNLTL
jgi:hypothetical protein